MRLTLIVLFENGSHVLLILCVKALEFCVSPCLFLPVCQVSLSLDRQLDFLSSTDGIIQKCTSLYIFELRVFQWKTLLLIKFPDILSATSLTFRQTRYQALYKGVQCLIADTTSIAVRGTSYTYMRSFIPPELVMKDPI